MVEMADAGSSTGRVRRLEKRLGARQPQLRQAMAPDLWDLEAPVLLVLLEMSSVASQGTTFWWTTYVTGPTCPPVSQALVMRGALLRELLAFAGAAFDPCPCVLWEEILL